jgi:hypothetical protein
MLQGRDEGRGVQTKAVRGAPVSGHAERDQKRAGFGHQEAEGAIERRIVPTLAHVAEDHRLGTRLGVRRQGSRR